MSSLLIALGCYRFLTDLKEKERLIEDFITFLVFGQTNSAIQEFCKCDADAEEISRGNETIVCIPRGGGLTADVLEVIFNKIDYSPKGSNARGREGKEVGYLRDFIMNIEGDEQLKLTDILVFGTGADQVPALGFSPDPTLKFTKGFLPGVNTCALQLYLSLHDTYSAFKETIFGMIISAGFGKA